MELEVFVPTAAARVRQALSDPERVARALPGFQRDAGAATPTSGRLKVRVGGHTITYRGALRVAEREDGAYTVEGEATEARGTGTVKLSLTLTLADTDDADADTDGTRVTVEGTATADGRIAQLPAEQVNSAAARLLSRFAENLGAAEEPKAEDPRAEEPREEPEKEAEPQASEAETAEPTEEAPAPPTEESSTEESPNEESSTEEPPPAESPAPEAAHARRTMIGRSAEEVDHAPPRGRYAPVPAPPVTAQANTLRWAAPAAALAVASAIVVGRVLRRRR
ncbi:Carbon monoxide dehydrogenase subunit G [Streptomyces sp. DI166]|uniref:SRPBCC domain-containing protein n=1 Tax=Streptomyces sp. DI166 TaxID=1839783 RepID=UPI0007F3AED2|nr:SRPBCC domain-containing protein [Streptomyces sp. DI166]SBT93696.1 Carbon monoxide dehydrogenase subunit G [Streptomyces sp. DI166]